MLAAALVSHESLVVMSVDRLSHVKWWYAGCNLLMMQDVRHDGFTVHVLNEHWDLAPAVDTLVMNSS